MFTHKDVEFRSIFVINCIKDRNLRVSGGELLLEEAEEKKTLTKLPFQKILAIFVIGNISVTTPLIEKCKKFNVALVVLKPSLRPVFYWSAAAEANFLLRERQFKYSKTDISIAKVLVTNKISNQLALLERTRQKDALMDKAKKHCCDALDTLQYITEYDRLMGIEGSIAKYFFGAYFQSHEWKQRMPRTKCDAINATLDIGYTILFNYIECFVRMFGFDLYVGVYHRLWFKRKSLVCDLMEPFRCIIDSKTRIAFNKKQCKKSDFNIVKNEYCLKHEKSAEYYHMFFEALIPYKSDVFKYMQCYYRSFMQQKDASEYPKFMI